ncbi:hypothetical protein ACRAWF_19805 [Streptomyces sp. L7]
MRDVQRAARPADPAGRPPGDHPPRRRLGAPRRSRRVPGTPTYCALQEVDRFQERSGRVDQAAVAAVALGALDWRYATALHSRFVPGRGWVNDPAEPAPRIHGTEALEPQVPSQGVALLSPACRSASGGPYGSHRGRWPCR